MGGADGTELEKRVTKYLTDAHALEGQALELLSRAIRLVPAGEPAEAFEEHRRATERHRQLVADRLRARGATPNRLKDTALRAGALNWGAFFGAQPDTPAKLAGFAYAFENLEVAAYEMLRRVADRAGDGETSLLAGEILAEETQAAERIRGLFDAMLDATLRGRGLIPG
jgi:ferritin-like metal-binding protein YciE